MMKCNILCLIDDVSAVIALSPALKFNGGGHINHSIFWETLSPNSGSISSDLESAIKVFFNLILISLAYVKIVLLFTVFLLCLNCSAISALLIICKQNYQLRRSLSKVLDGAGSDTIKNQTNLKSQLVPTKTHYKLLQVRMDTSSALVSAFRLRNS